MKPLGSFVLFLAAAATGLALAASAAGKTSASTAKTRHVNGRIEALALDGNRIAYDVGSTSGVDNKVLVWNVRTGKTTRVSGNKTRQVDDSSTGSGVFELAIAGIRVAWLANVGGNSEGDDYLFTSSVVKPKERRVAWVMRSGDNCPGRSQSNCAGPWLGGLVGSGGVLALNRWTTDGTGTVAGGELDVLGSTRITHVVASGTDAVEAASADAARVAVLHPDATVGLYAASGGLLLDLGQANAEAVALSGRNLVVLTKMRTLEVYNTQTGNRRRILSVQGSRPRNLDVQGNVAIYTTKSSVHAINLSSGKDRVVGKLHRGDVAQARIDSVGLAYAGNKTLVFVPLERVAAAVSR